MQGKSYIGGIVVSVALVSVLGAAGSGERAVAQEEQKPRVFAFTTGEAPYVVEVDGEDRAYLGVTLEEETDWAEGGARITRVVDESPAAGAGLQQGDIIVRFNGETIRGPMALTKAIHETEPGESVKLTVVREGREQKFEIEMGERASLWRQNVVVAPEWTEDLKQRMEEMGESMGQGFSCAGEDCASLFPPCEGDDCKNLLQWKYQFDIGRPVLGVELVEVTPELRRHLGAGDERGVLVGKVLSGTPAEQAGIRVGDLIVSVGGEDIGDTGDLRSALREKRGESFTVEVIREKRKVSVEVTIPERERERPSGPRAASAPRTPEMAALARVPMPPAPPSAVAAPSPMAPPAPPAAVAGPTPMAPPAPPAAVAGPAPMAPPAPVAVPLPPDASEIVKARRADMEALRQAELAWAEVARERGRNIAEVRRAVEQARAEQAMALDEARQETRRAREEVQRALEVSRAAQGEVRAGHARAVDEARRAHAEARGETLRALELERQALREARSWMREVI